MTHSNGIAPCIGIVDQTSAAWTGGETYTRTIAYGLKMACQGTGARLSLLSRQKLNNNQQHYRGIDLIQFAEAPYFRGEWRLRRLLGLSEKSDLLYAARERQITVLLPMQYIRGPLNGIRTIGWIPDFQHLYLPELFSEAEREIRDNRFRRLAREACLIMLSSRNTIEHFEQFCPEYAYKARLASFPSRFVFEPPDGDVNVTLKKFNIPSKFALVVNQFWCHKNHLVVIDAVTSLRRRGVRIPVVMVGLPADYRDPSNSIVSSVLQAVASGDLTGQVSILGLVATKDFENLIRAAAVIVQPSRFEGWNTTVQDAKALGRPLICSDIAVHREQAPDAAGFFPCDRPEALADLLVELWPKLEPSHQSREEASLASERAFANNFGQTVFNICKEAHSL